MISFGDQFAVNGYVAHGLLKIVTGGIGELLEIVVGAAEFLFLLFLFVDIGIGADPHGNAAPGIAIGVWTRVRCQR